MAGIKENSELEFVWVEPEKAIKHKDNKVADNIKTGFYIIGDFIILMFYCFFRLYPYEFKLGVFFYARHIAALLILKTQLYQYITLFFQ